MNNNELDSLFNDLDIQLNDADALRDFLESSNFTYSSYGIGISNYITAKENAQNKLGDVEI